MKNKAKRIVSAVCALAMCAAMLPAAAFADEPIADSSIQVMSDEKQMDFTLSVGQTIELDGEPTTNTHSWTVGGSNKDCIEFVNGDDSENVTIKAVKGGTCTVTHSYGTENWWQRGIEVFSITVNASPTLENMTFQVEVTAMPYNEDGTQAISVEIPFELTYRGDKPGNLADESFGTVEYTATVNAANTPVEVTTNESVESLPVGFYCLSFAGDENVWDKDAALQDESIYYEVTAEGAVNLVNKAGSSTSSEENRVVTLNPKLYTLDYRSGSSAGDIVGEAPDDVTYQYNQIATVAENTMTREGYTFVNWKDMMGEQFWNPGDTIQVTSNINLFANWVEGTVDPNPEPEPEPDPDPGEDEEVQWEVSKSKTATNLDENYESQVTLSLPAADEQLVSDVVFVLDKSTSTDVEDEMIAMLEALSTQVAETDAKVKVGIVIFNKVANSVLELTELNDTNMSAIEDAVKTAISSGTNTHAGLLAGQKMLDEDTSVDANRKYMIFVSDGLTYIFDAEANAINSQQSATGENAVMAGNDCWSIRHYDEGGNDFIPVDWNAYLSDVGDHLDEVQQYIQPYASMSQENHIPRGNTVLPTTVDVAMYKTSQTLEMMMDKGYNCYVMQAEAPAASDYPWGPAFMEYLQEETGNGEVTFEEIQNDIYYLLDAGSKVVDVIGYGEDYDFEFVNEASALTMTVGKETLATKKISENEYGFGTANDGVYPYVLTYQPADTSTGTEEQFTWTMNVPVSQFAPVQLTYTVRLTNPKTEVGTYGQYDEDGSEGYDGLLTNKSATLNPVDSNDQPGKPEEFAKPTVSYTVNPSLTPIIPLPGSSELGDLLNVKVVCVTNTAHEEYHSGVPAGSYSIQLVDSDTAIVTLPNDRFVELYNMMNPSTTHTLADSSAKGYTVELSLVDSKWVRTDPSVEIVFEVACETPSETVTVPGTSSTPTSSTPSATPTPTPTAQTTAIPQTSDDLPLGLLIVVAIAAAGAVCGLVVLRKRSKQ